MPRHHYRVRRNLLRLSGAAQHQSQRRSRKSRIPYPHNQSPLKSAQAQKTSAAVAPERQPRHPYRQSLSVQKNRMPPKDTVSLVSALPLLA